MDETEFVHSFQSQRDLGHVETSDVLGEDFVFDQHGHEITTWQELHEHVEEGRVLERCVQLDKPRTVGICKDIAFGAHVSELVLLELRQPCQLHVGRRRIFQHTISALTRDLRA